MLDMMYEATTSPSQRVSREIECFHELQKCMSKSFTKLDNSDSGGYAILENIMTPKPIIPQVVAYIMQWMKMMVDVIQQSFGKHDMVRQK